MPQNDERPHGRALEEQLRIELSRVLDREARRLRDTRKNGHATVSPSGRDDSAIDDDANDLATGVERQLGPVSRRHGQIRRRGSE